MWWHSFAVLVDLLQSGTLSWQCCWQPVEEWSAERWIRSANEEHTPTWEGNYLGCNSWGKIKCDSSPRGVSHMITPEMFMKRERLLQNVMTAVCHLQVSTRSMKWMLWKLGAIVAGNTFTVDKHLLWLNIQNEEIISEEKNKNECERVTNPFMLYFKVKHE